MERPERVRRVTPPSTTMLYTHTAVPPIQKASCVLAPVVRPRLSAAAPMRALALPVTVCAITGPPAVGASAARVALHRLMIVALRLTADAVGAKVVGRGVEVGGRCDAWIEQRKRCLRYSSRDKGVASHCDENAAMQEGL